MNNNPQNKEEKELKKGFFKKVWYSIDKIDKYSELSAEGLGKAIKYLAILIIILSCITSLGSVYTTSKSIKQLASYIDKTIPELEYKDEKLTVSGEPIIDNETEYGKVIIDTTVEDEQKINEYIESIKNEEKGAIVLKNRLIMKTIGIQEAINYNYTDLLKQTNITEFNKQELIDYLTGSNMMSIYSNLFISLMIYSFAVYMINTLFNIAVISIFAYLATFILKLKIRYVAVFNMVVYAVTLPTILQMLYVIINVFCTYTIPYFDIMYILVSTIYVMAAIFILKGEFNKKQGEVQKIVEVEEQVKEEIKKKKEEKKEEDKKENKEPKKKNKKEEKEEDKNEGEEPEGSNA